MNMQPPFDQVQFQSLQEKVDQLSDCLNARLDAIRLDSIDARLNRLNDIDARLDSIDARLDSLDARLDSIDACLDRMESKMTAM